MAFMIPEYLYVRAWHIDTMSEGTRPFFASTPMDSLELCNGEEDTESAQQWFADLLEVDEEDILQVDRDRFPMWYVRLSAPGYMDCTEWTGPFNTEREARQHLIDEDEVHPDTGESIYDEDEEA